MLEGTEDRLTAEDRRPADTKAVNQWIHRFFSASLLRLFWWRSTVHDLMVLSIRGPVLPPPLASENAGLITFTARYHPVLYQADGAAAARIPSEVIQLSLSNRAGVHRHEIREQPAIHHDQLFPILSILISGTTIVGRRWHRNLLIPRTNAYYF